MRATKITAVIIAKNEEEMIEGCLDSLSSMDKIVVIDNGSSDKTIEIAKKRGATVVSSDVTSFSKLREFALSKVTSEYIFYIDADERVSSELQEEITEILTSKNSFVAYRVPRKNYYLGKHPWPTVEYLERLFYRKQLKGWRGVLHETAIVDGDIGVLNHLLLHYTHRDFSSMVEKTNKWSEAEAKLRLDANHPPITWWRFPRVMIMAFFQSYVSQKGWKIGTPGLLESIYQSFSIFITYAKLWELQQQSKKK